MTSRRRSPLGIPSPLPSLAHAAGGRGGGHVYLASSIGLGAGFGGAWFLAPRSSLAVRLVVGLGCATVAGVVALRWW